MAGRESGRGKIILIGDLHGDVSVLETLPAEAGDLVVILGDAGFLFYGAEREFAVIRAMERLPFQIAFLDGNHDNLPLIEKNKSETWNGGQVHRLSGNLLHLMRGEIFHIAGLSFFVFGGGASADRGRRTEGVDYWRRELPSPGEYDHAWQTLQRAGFRADYILCHTAPTDAVLLLNGKLKAPEEEPLNNFLLRVRRHTEYRRLLFGHFHRDLELPERQTAVWRKPVVLLPPAALATEPFIGYNESMQKTGREHER